MSNSLSLKKEAITHLWSIGYHVLVGVLSILILLYHTQLCSSLRIFVGDGQAEKGDDQDRQSQGNLIARSDEYFNPFYESLLLSLESRMLKLFQA